jgi:hypothetical protein
MTEQDKRVFPIVYSFDGRPSEDGSAFLVEAIAFEGSVARFAIPVDNIQHFIAFLLIWVRELSGGHSSGTHADGSESDGCIPIPATSIAIGQPSGDQVYIAISVGRAELVFSLPASSLGPVGQSLMLAGAPLNAEAS